MIPLFQKSGRLLLVLGVALPGLALAMPNAHDRIGVIPVFAFPIGSSVNVFRLPGERTYVYYANGDYFRWQVGRWTVAPLAAGPWKPPAPGIIIPRALIFGPPPPVEADAAYFEWWRRTAAPWWRLHHPRWWAAFHAQLRDYPSFREKLLPRLEAHPHFWRFSGSLRLRPVFASGEIMIQPSQVQAKILTHDLSGRYYEDARRAYEWRHSWGESPGFDRDPFLPWPEFAPDPGIYGGSITILGGGYGDWAPWWVWGSFPNPIFWGGFFWR